MAQITNWLKYIGRPSKRRLVMIKGMHPLPSTGNFEIWITDQDNRVLRCALTLPEATALGASLRTYLAQAQSPGD
jgi:hypothetical protein